MLAHEVEEEQVGMMQDERCTPNMLRQDWGFLHPCWAKRRTVEPVAVIWLYLGTFSVNYAVDRFATSSE